MRTTLAVLGTLAVMGTGCATTGAAPAQVDEHAGHDMGTPAAGAGMQQVRGIPAGATDAAARLSASPRHGEWVSIKLGEADSVMAWVVYPERRDRAPVVIAIHENTGLNTWTRGVADQLAADGFIGIAPDLTTMFRTDDLKSDPAPDAGRAAIGRVTPEMANRVLDAVARYGMSLPAARPRYGIMGFCWGGARSFSHATHAPGLGASVVYYGSPPSAEAMGAIRAPVLGLYGGNDARINATIPAADSTMKALGKSYVHHTFEGAGHGFLRGQSNSLANADASRQAWPLTIAFFRANLGR